MAIERCCPWLAKSEAERPFNEKSGTSRCGPTRLILRARFLGGAGGERGMQVFLEPSERFICKESHRRRGASA